MIYNDRGLSEEQRMMRDACRAFVNDFVTPFIRKNWQAEWSMNPDGRLPREILEQAHKIGIRTLGIPEEFGGTPLDPKTEVQTFAMISEEISRGDAGLSGHIGLANMLGDEQRHLKSVRYGAGDVPFLTPNVIRGFRGCARPAPLA